MGLIMPPRHRFKSFSIGLEKKTNFAFLKVDYVFFVFFVSHSFETIKKI